MESGTMTPAERAFYTAQSATSDPGEFANLLATLPADSRHIVGVVSGLLLHPVFLARQGVDHPHARGGDAEVRPARELLRRIVERDARPLGVARPYERRVIGTCRHYALLAATILRHHGLPSRLRVGFATYFVRGFHEDHWLCEYWDGDTWRLLDAELDNEAISREYAVDFPPWDVPRDRFLTAGEAWRALRRGTIDGETCGVSFIPAVRGAWFVGASILRDLAALNTRELLPWDYWGLARGFSSPGTTIPPAAVVRLDEIAALTAGPAPDWQALRAPTRPPTIFACRQLCSHSRGESRSKRRSETRPVSALLRRRAWRTQRTYMAKLQEKHGWYRRAGAEPHASADRVLALFALRPLSMNVRQTKGWETPRSVSNGM